MERSISYVDDDKKVDISQVEDITNVDGTQPGAIPVSAFASHTPGQIIRKFYRLYAHNMMIAVGALYIGYATAISGSIIANPGFINVFGEDVPAAAGGAHRRAAGAAPAGMTKMLNPVHVSLWGGLNLTAQLVFQLAAGPISDKFGRKIVLYIMTFFVALTIVLECIAKDWKVYLVSKITAGMACSFLGTGLAVYASEIAMPQSRGAFMMPFTLSFAGGSLVSAICLKIVASDPGIFRRAFYSQFLFLALWIGPLFYLPETPMWLCRQGKHDKGKAALRKLIGNVEGYDIEHEYSVLQYEVEQSEAEAARASTTSWMAVLKWRNLKRVVISAIPGMSQGPLGAALTFGYATYFFLLAGIPDPFLANVMQNVILICGVFGSSFTADYFGRRTLMLVGSAGCCVTVFGIAGFSYVPLTSKVGPNGIVAMVCLWMFFYSGSILPISWTLLTELSTVSLRAKSVGIGAAMNSGVQLILQYTVPIMLGEKQWGAKIGFLFGGMGAIVFTLVFFLIPETKGRAPQEIDELFDRKVPAWKWTKTTTALQQAVEDKKAAEARV